MKQLKLGFVWTSLCSDFYLLVVNNQLSFSWRFQTLLIMKSSWQKITCFFPLNVFIIIKVLSPQQVILWLQICILQSHLLQKFLYLKLIICPLPNKVGMLWKKRCAGLKYSWRSKMEYWLLFTIDCIGFHEKENWLLKEKPKSLQMLGFGKEGENRCCLMICFHEMSALALKLQSWFDGKLQEAAHLWLTLPSTKKIDLRRNWVDADLITHTHTQRSLK